MVYSINDFAQEPGVTQEVLTDFDQWHDILTRWNAKINLVSQSALGDFWFRHALDSWQLTAHIPDSAKTILDLGSGGGFPGLALAMHCKHRGMGHVTLVESAGKKANFLRAVIRQLSLPASVEDARAENLEPKPYDIISARAFAPLPRLLEYAKPFWGESTKAVLLKGQSVNAEIYEAQEDWDLEFTLTPSQSDPEGSVLIVTNLVSSH